jgi:hypothetical protein
MDIHKVHTETAKIHNIILTTITIVFSTLSCFSILFTLIAFRFVKIIKKNREKSRTKDLTVITTHLCLCLLASLLIFLIGILIHHLNLRVIIFFSIMHFILCYLYILYILKDILLNNCYNFTLFVSLCIFMDVT